MDTEFDEAVPDESEQLDQLQRDETLINRGVDDVLDEGYIPPDHWSPAEGYGNTVEEMHRGETLDQRLRQEDPEPDGDDDGDWNPDHEKREVGSRRAGRLVDGTHGYGGLHDDSNENIAEEVGLAGGAASAEEAAMYVIDDDELDADGGDDE